jgi:PPOX class probable F420-dependent enzyme
MTRDRLTTRETELLERANFGHLATLMPDGSPHIACVWVDVRDGLVWINTPAASVKTHNVRRDPRVALSVCDYRDPYRMVTIRGRVVEVTYDGAREHRYRLSQKYRRADKSASTGGRTNLILKIHPEYVTSAGV